ncbi:MAG: YggS family pyridoxal phosphate-dependent enzyme [FCB group bacterium]|nr:YggS family pyridoxal phosphate-dependent enzyme [FCB group bacterium]MBL7028861.1 YggS family pyridoxal phosphate-dependent enzyme [Candidatus Neomarinimicrobiota bacterium]MBL7121684.1 YggS family pyridoxal phosphate-dependent enzyme [Candidatus Neomarinimicrobiota bacterium]
MGTSTFAERLSQIQDEVAEAAHGVGRATEDITLIGVSKRKPVEDMQQAYDAGLRDFGENRAQEVRDKFPGFNPAGIVKHFIGHLQSNKVKYLPGRVDIIHTIDSTRIADAVDQRFGAQELTIPVLVEINISGETNKEGVEPIQALELAAYCAEKPHLEFQGLMTIGPLTADIDRIRQAFREMKLIHEQVVRQIGTSGKTAMLSMGMSSDFKIAIEEGATHIRVGTALFGAREY